MIVNTLNKNQAAKAFNEWRDNKYPEPSLNADYQRIRKDLCSLYSQTLLEVGNVSNRADYFKDVFFGLKLREYLKNQDWFNLRHAANLDFWKYLCIKVVPDLVRMRWGDNGSLEDHYWKRPSRIWLFSIWWYAYVAGNESETYPEMKKRLIAPLFTTDSIQALIERNGNGIDVALYREIVKYGSALRADEINQVKFSGSNNLLRAVMKLNTSQRVTKQPSLCRGGVEGYVKSLFDMYIKK